MRDLVTTVLELVGLVLLAVAAGLAVAAVSVPGGVATFGALLIGVAAVVELRAKPRQQVPA